jgi:hypothetical protein
MIGKKKLNISYVAETTPFQS